MVFCKVAKTIYISYLNLYLCSFNSIVVQQLDLVFLSHKILLQQYDNGNTSIFFNTDRKGNKISHKHQYFTSLVQVFYNENPEHNSAVYYKRFQFVFIILLISSLEAGAGRADRRRSQSVPRDGRSTTHKESYLYCQVLFL